MSSGHEINKSIPGNNQYPVYPGFETFCNIEYQQRTHFTIESFRDCYLPLIGWLGVIAPPALPARRHR